MTFFDEIAFTYLKKEMANILVIDDSKFSRDRLIKPLVQNEHQIVEAANGEEGLLAVESHNLDLVVTDLLMPVVDGQEFLRRLRAGGSTLPVIVVSADVQSTSRTHCEELGISGFLNKPFSTDELLECVERVLLEKEGQPV